MSFATADRQRWLNLMTRASRAELEHALARLPEPPQWQTLRPAECGLVMVRGRAGGSGQRFNLGEMTVSRCAVRLNDGTVGHGYSAGRDTWRAERIAVLDALMQGPARARLEQELLEPLHQRLADHRATEARQAAATKVDFFTVAREGGQ